jgi:hypothetical protein
MKNTLLFPLLSVALTIVTEIHAQTETKISVGIENGVNLYSSELSDGNSIRKDFVWSSERYPSDNIRTIASSFYLGAKAEALFFDKIGLSGGLRISMLHSEVSTPLFSGSDFFYYLFRESGTTTEYLKIHEMEQVSTYVGVPLAFRFFPYKASFLRLYFKAEGDVSLRLASSNHVSFCDENMDKYRHDVFKSLKSPSAVYSNVGCGIGLRFGKEIRPKVNVELLYISSVYNHNSSLVSLKEGVNLQVCVQIPVNYKKAKQ